MGKERGRARDEAGNGRELGGEGRKRGEGQEQEAGTGVGRTRWDGVLKI